MVRSAIRGALRARALPCERINTPPTRAALETPLARREAAAAHRALVVAGADIHMRALRHAVLELKVVALLAPLRRVTPLAADGRLASSTRRVRTAGACALVRAFASSGDVTGGMCSKGEKGEKG